MAKPYTISGLYIKDDKHLGLLVYSPFSGLIHAVSRDNKHEVLSWVNGNDEHKEKYSEIVRSIGELDSVQFKTTHFLPSLQSFPLTTHCESPILINWMLTKSCALKCKYCFARDIIQSDEPENIDSIPIIANTILSKHPLAVVLTGGDPLSSPYFSEALDALKGKVGIIVDTNGVGLTTEIAASIHSASAVMRISIDSHNHKDNNLLRCSKSTSVNAHNAAINAISTCKELGIPYSVHTVLTKRSMTTLRPLGNALFFMGVKSWRIFALCPFGDKTLWSTLHPSERNEQYYTEEILARRNSPSGWNRKMSVQIVPSSRPESVILVTPSGRFMLQPTGKDHKIPVDEQSPSNPSIGKIMDSIDVTGHIERYLNLQSR